MTVLEMLELRCDFHRNLPAQAAEKGVFPDLPEDVLELYRQTDGGCGYLEPRPWKEGPDLILYSREEMEEMRQWLAEVAAESDEAGCFAGRDVAVLGQCGDGDWPEYLCRYKGTYFLKDRDSLDESFDEEEISEEVCFTDGDFLDFMTRVLWYLEVEEL